MTRPTAGELSLKAAQDQTVYDPLELSHAMLNDAYEQLMLCAKDHEKIIDEEEFFIVLQVATDCLIKVTRRHKYAAFVHMPKPRPCQACFLFNKKTQKLKRLWSLPNAEVMAVMAEMPYVDPKWQSTKKWCDAFYKGWSFDPKSQKFVNEDESHFYKLIRKENNITHLSEKEFLDAYHDELVNAGCKDIGPLPAEPFDFSKINTEKVVNPTKALSDKN